MRGILGNRAFHLAIVEACANTALTETVQTVWDSRRGRLFAGLGVHVKTVEFRRAAIDEDEAVELRLLTTKDRLR